MNININNYEEWMVDYIEGNLSKVQEEKLMHFLEVHPELKSELEIFQQTKLQPDMHMVFENKEMLKKEEAGRVIGMPVWRKYAIGIAAAMLLFAGVKFLSVNNADVSGIKYTAKEISKPVFAFKQKETTDSGAIQSEKNIKQQPEIYFAEEKEIKKEKFADDKKELKEENKMEQIQRDANFVTEDMEFASIDEIDVIKHRGRIERDVNENYLQYTYANYVQPEMKTKNNNTIIDKYNNTVAFTESIGSLLGFGKDDKEKNDTDDLKETHIKIFDIEYYNRKKTDK
ncbi:MAG: hypothetical protein H7Y00_14985 [Fimbriimonadaceae bacterium]|nr:hypothetical protein [Chitinophagales bacterium]